VVVVDVANNNSGKSLAATFTQIKPEMVIQWAYAVSAPCVINQR
jgi:hypothetical protein